MSRRRSCSSGLPSPESSLLKAVMNYLTNITYTQSIHYPWRGVVVDKENAAGAAIPRLPQSSLLLQRLKPNTHSTRRKSTRAAHAIHAYNEEIYGENGTTCHNKWYISCHNCFNTYTANIKESLISTMPSHFKMRINLIYHLSRGMAIYTHSCDEQPSNIIYLHWDAMICNVICRRRRLLPSLQTCSGLWGKPGTWGTWRPDSGGTRPCGDFPPHARDKETRQWRHEAVCRLSTTQKHRLHWQHCSDFHS